LYPIIVAKQKNKPLQLFGAGEPPTTTPIKMVGIVAVVPAYKLAWQVNNTLHLRLLREDDLFYTHKRGDDIFIQCFEYVDEEYDTTIRLIANKTNRTILIPEHRNTNYFLQMKGDQSEITWEDFLLQLKALPLVLTLYEVEWETLRNKEMLYF